MSDGVRLHYEQRAQATDDPTLIAGRHSFQREAERRIVPDLQTKLDLRPGDKLLDIGGGAGNLAIPLSFLVERVVVVDNGKAVALLEARLKKPNNISVIAGGFEHASFSHSFDKILAYSMFQYLADFDAMKAFLSKAVGLLAPGGRLLLGDLPNISLKARFMASARAAETQAAWARSMAAEGETEAHRRISSLAPPRTGPAIDDRMVAELLLFLRSLGVEAYVLPQPESLPFGLTREDILVVAHR